VRIIRRVASLILIIALVANIIPLTPLNASASTIQQLSRVALVKLWEVSHETYMAKFIGEKYIVITTEHGDASLDGRLISVAPNKKVYIYKVETGELIGTLTADSNGDTWIVTSWEPFQAQKVWDRSGFFSGNSKIMIEDPRKYGTDARLVDTETWTATPLAWGFNDTNGEHFYAAQLDYSGATLAVSYIYEGRLLVFRHGTKVTDVSPTTKCDYGRRLQVTLDGKYIVVGGLNCPSVDIYKWNEEAGLYLPVASIDLGDPGGAGALGISDPYKIGYIIIGTYNGWVIIAKFDPVTETVSIIYKEKLAPDESWFYNPFYERWIPKVTEVFALASQAGIGVVYDVPTNQTIVINYGGSYGYWKAAAVSPEANYVFIGNALYMIVRRDVQSTHPRVRFWGTMTFERGYQDLGTPLVLEAPERDWHLYFFSGRLTIKRIYVEPVPVDLVEDMDIQNGRLSKMLAKGLISAETFYTENAEVRELEVVPGSEVADVLREGGIENPDNYVATLSMTHFTPPPYFWEGHAWTGTVIHVPLDKPINVYDDIMLQISTSIHTTSLAYDKNKRALGVLGIPVEIGGGIGVSAAAYSRIANKVLLWYVARHGIDTARLAAIATSQTVAKVAGVVGIAVAVWGGLDAILVEWGGFGDVNIQNWIMIAPVVEDSLGNKYTAIQLILPLEESDNVQRYYDILSRYFKDLGYKDVGFRVTYPCRTWDEYKNLIAAGYSPQIKLDDLIELSTAST